LNSKTGVFTWRPTEAQSPTTNIIQIIATDDGSPPLTDTKSVTVIVKKPNEPPIITLSTNYVKYREKTGPRILDNASVVTDPDSMDFDQGTLTVAITEGMVTGDVLGIQSQATGDKSVSVNAGNNVYYGTQLLGSLTLITKDTNLLTLSLNANASPLVVQSVLRQITFSNPDSGAKTTNRVILFAVSDGDGGTSVPVKTKIEIRPPNRPPHCRERCRLNDCQHTYHTFDRQVDDQR
jgi:hypothetical protein